MNGWAKRTAQVTAFLAVAAGIGEVMGAVTGTFEVGHALAQASPVFWFQANRLVGEKTDQFSRVADSLKLLALQTKAETLDTKRKVLKGQLTAYEMALRMRPDDPIALEAKADRTDELLRVNREIDQVACQISAMRGDLLQCADTAP
jgi:hypothetical protein